jgi:hypothetical protein
MRQRASLADVAQGFLYGYPLIRRLRLVIIWSQKQGALNGVGGRRESDKNPACGRQVILGEGVYQAMYGRAAAHG